jgi:starvation-inducible DNA-binding protein
MEHVTLLAERLDAYLNGLRLSRQVGQKHEDTDTVDQVTQVVTEFEKNAWFLRATLGG